MLFSLDIVCLKSVFVSCWRHFKWPFQRWSCGQWIISMFASSCFFFYREPTSRWKEVVKLASSFEGTTRNVKTRIDFLSHLWRLTKTNAWTVSIYLKILPVQTTKDQFKVCRWSERSETGAKRKIEHQKVKALSHATGGADLDVLPCASIALVNRVTSVLSPPKKVSKM